MIYKFNDETRVDTNVEFELIDGYLNIFSRDNVKEEIVSVSLTKEDVYKLIGALHCIQKEME
jgi:hypothetical protein